AQLPGREAAQTAHRTEAERNQGRPSRPEGPSLRDEQGLERIEANEPTEGRAQEAKRTEEGRPAGEESGAEEGERQVEVNQPAIKLRDEENERHADEEGEPEGSDDRESETCERVADGRHRPSRPLQTVGGPFQRTDAGVGG